MNVHANLIQDRGRVRRYRHPTRSRETGKVHIRPDTEAGNQHVAGQEQGLSTALQANRGVSRGRQTRIPDANVVDPGAQVGEQTALVADIPTQSNLASARGAADIAELQPVLVEDRDALYVTQAVGNAIHRQIGVLKAHLPIQYRILEPSAHPCIQGHLPRGNQLRVDRVHQCQVQATIGMDVYCSPLRVAVTEHRRRSTHPQVGVRAAHAEAVYGNNASAQRELNGLGLLHRDALDRQAEGRERGRSSQKLWLCRGPAHGDGGRNIGRGIRCTGLEQGHGLGHIDTRQGQLCLCLVIPGQRSLSIGCDLRAHQLRRQVIKHGRPG